MPKMFNKGGGRKGEGVREACVDGNSWPGMAHSNVMKTRTKRGRMKLSREEEKPKTEADDRVT